MDYEYVENLVLSAKEGNEKAKEKLVKEFQPLILGLSKKTFIHGYEECDLQSEGYRTLFKCVSLYKPENHRFVAYATNGIKNRMHELIRHYMNRIATDSSETLVLTGYVAETICDNSFSIDDNLIKNSKYEVLRQALDILSNKDNDLIDFVFFKENSIKNYAESRNVSYSTALRRRDRILEKLFVYINSIDSDFALLN